jgi:hypothetical protein
MAERAARHQRDLGDDLGFPRLADQFVAVHGDRVLHGPFTGLRYWRGGDAPVAKLLGTYESEISPWFTDVLADPPPLFVDIGAADGYYAVGVKVASPETEVVAFEISATARGELAELARLNGVGIDIRRRASARAIRTLPLSGALLLCDIEGAEADVLPPLAPALMRTTLIVELHEHSRPAVTDLLTRCFRTTHTIERVHTRGREPASFHELAILDAKQRAAALNERRRATMAWARFTPRVSS